MTTVIGPNGAGKSTLLKLILGLTSPTSGTLTRMPGLKIGYMPQKIVVAPDLPLTVESFLSLWKGATPNTIHQCLQQARCLSLKHRPLQGLSGGELQRVLLARALLNQPDLLILDEPVQGVDVLGQQDLYNVIKDLKTNCSILMVSHDLHMVLDASDHVICLNRHICCEGHPGHVRNSQEFQTMFGPLVPYTHHHDHCHDTTTGEPCAHDHHLS